MYGWYGHTILTLFTYVARFTVALPLQWPFLPWNIAIVEIQVFLVGWVLSEARRVAASYLINRGQYYGATTGRNRRKQQGKTAQRERFPAGGVSHQGDMLSQTTSWPVASITVSILIAIGVGVMSMNPPDFLIAKLAFSAAAGILSLKVAYWVAKSGSGTGERAVLAFLIFGAIGTLAVESWKWVDRRAALVNTRALGRLGTINPVCKVKATADSRIIERVYFRGIQPDMKNEYPYQPKLREWFYEWTLSLEVSNDISDVIVTVDNVLRNERPKLVSNLPTTTMRIQPHWKSGFQEPGLPPDNYTGAFEFGKLSTGIITKVIIRRPITFLNKKRGRVWFPLNYAARNFDISAAMPCEVEKINYDFSKQADKVMVELVKLFNHRLNGEKYVPFRSDPDVPLPPLGKNEIQGIMELECDSDACLHPKPIEISARWGERDEWAVPLGEADKKK